MRGVLVCILLLQYALPCSSFSYSSIIPARALGSPALGSHRPSVFALPCRRALTHFCALAASVRGGTETIDSVETRIRLLWELEDAVGVIFPCFFRLIMSIYLSTYLFFYYMYLSLLVYVYLPVYSFSDLYLCMFYVWKHMLRHLLSLTHSCMLVLSLFLSLLHLGHRSVYLPVFISVCLPIFLF